MKPKFIPHECESEPGCKICRDYVNKLDDYRQKSISNGGDTKREVIFRLVVTSRLDKIGENKSKFDLPTPRLSRPF